MTEAEIISEIGFRSEILWNLTQWWVSICFAVMVASYMGRDHLSRALTGLIVILFSWYTLVVAQGVLEHLQFMGALYDGLSFLQENSQLGIVGQAALEINPSQQERVGLPYFLFTAFVVTNGFVIFSYLKLRKSQ